MRCLAKPALALSALLLAACGANGGDAPATVEVKDVTVRLSPVDGRPGVAYFTVRGGKAADRLTAVSADRIANVELHEGRMVDGVMSMRPLAGVDIPAGATVKFESGGDHAMLYGVDPAIRPGDAIALTFRFASGAAPVVQAKAQAAGAAGGDEHAGH